MPTRRQVVQGISATLPFSFVVETLVPDALTGSPAYAQAASNGEALAGHFHPKGKPPSRFTIELLQQARATLPFADQRDFEEQRRGLIAPMLDLQIMADAGHVAWNMERFQFIDQQDEFDSIHPSLHRIARLNNNYGLYEVIPGIYQVRGLDLSDISFVRGKSGWIVFDPLVSAEVVRAAWELFQEHVGEGLAAQITETPRFADARSEFVRSVVAQRGACIGMSALLSSAIELEAHQVEVVRRVLQDPIQRYLLADEVGLGKTIEAGILIRQCFLDGGPETQVVVLTPAALVPQWRAELATRFFLDVRLDSSLHVLSLGQERQTAGRAYTLRSITTTQNI